MGIKKISCKALRRQSAEVAGAESGTINGQSTFHTRPAPVAGRCRAATRAGAGKTCGGHAGGTIPLLGAHWVGERMEQRKTMLWLPLGTIRAAPCLCRRAVCGLQWQRTSLLGRGHRVSLYLRSAGMPRGRPSAMDLIPFSGVS
jgi:hypothetical protein